MFKNSTTVFSPKCYKLRLAEFGSKRNFTFFKIRAFHFVENTFVSCVSKKQQPEQLDSKLDVSRPFQI